MNPCTAISVCALEAAHAFYVSLVGKAPTILNVAKNLEFHAFEIARRMAVTNSNGEFVSRYIINIEEKLSDNRWQLMSYDSPVVLNFKP